MLIDIGRIKSRVSIGSAWESVHTQIDPARTIIVTDINVGEIYGSKFPDCPVITIGTGEKIKELDTAETIIKHLLTIGADRSSFLLAIGGGLVCDITGFVASIFMRGIDFGFISTSLLSQVDASIGGKNGVNLKGIKNIIGCINQPDFVIIDTAFLESLPEEEYVSGLGELVKHGLIRDSVLFKYIEDNIDSVISRDKKIMEELVRRSIIIKAEIVSGDEKEKGDRRLLNFGHTLGHAIEASTGESHGISISTGMLVACDISVDEGLLEKSEYLRVRNVLKSLNLLPELKFNWPDISDKIGSDKKKSGRLIHYILLNGIGKAIQKEYTLESVIDKIRTKIN